MSRNLLEALAHVFVSMTELSSMVSRAVRQRQFRQIRELPPGWEDGRRLPH